MFKGMLGGAALTALFTGCAVAAPAQPQSQVWVVTPAADSCRTDIDLVGRSGMSAQVTLVSDGAHVELRFGKDEVPQRAFLPIRVDQKPYANLMLRMENPKEGAMTLSEETLEALRKGKSLSIAWLADEPVSAMLGGSEQGLTDLTTCGAQVSAQHKIDVAARDEAKAREDAEARAKAVTDEQLAAAKAAKEAAEATKARETAEADRLNAEQAALDAQRQQAEAAQRAQAEDAYYPYRRRVVQQPPPWARVPPGYRGYYPPDDDQN